MPRVMITNTFTPLMSPHRGVKIRPCTEREARRIINGVWESAVSHKVTAEILSERFGVKIPFNRINLQLLPGDKILACCPQYRAEIAREYTEAEIVGATWLYFLIKIL